MPERKAESDEEGSKGGLWWVVLVAILLFLAIILWPDPNAERRWLAAFGVFLGMFLGVGFAEKRRLFGIFINERNLFSLSRLQVVLWSSLFFSSLLVMFVVRWQGPVIDPFEVDLDPQVVALAGISLGSFATAAVVVGAKVKQDVDEKELEEEAEKTFEKFKGEYLADTEKRLNGPNLAAGQKKVLEAAKDDAGKLRDLAVEEIKERSRGPLFGNRVPGDAQWRDLIQGDEVANTRHADLSKVQMLVLTVIVFAGYSLLLEEQFDGYSSQACQTTVDDLASTQEQLRANCLGAFPAVSQGLALLMGASHAGYLLTKGAAHMKTV